ncbi:isocitrate/isopropylmalate family dehydrogenase [Pseudomonas aeruginosa]|nr:isocitrate/isopropylmalate family dehydrogenase [Pseudomonas aeruginosa]
MSKQILVLPGDGIGPEIMAEAVKVLELANDRFQLGSNWPRTSSVARPSTSTACRWPTRPCSARPGRCGAAGRGRGRSGTGSNAISVPSAVC